MGDIYPKVIMGTLGHKVFTPINTSIPTSEGSNADVNQQFFLRTSKVDASGKRTSDGFIVLKGSKIASVATKSCPGWIKQLHFRYQDKINDNILTDDLVFTSPSAAAGFVNYASANGLTSWITADGRTLKSIESTEE